MQHFQLSVRKFFIKWINFLRLPRALVDFRCYSSHIRQPGDNYVIFLYFPSGYTLSGNRWLSLQIMKIAQYNNLNPIPYYVIRFIAFYISFYIYDALPFFLNVGCCGNFSHMTCVNEDLLRCEEFSGPNGTLKFI